jgi:transcriptional regulator with XRE-family HTH domain
MSELEGRRHPFVEARCRRGWSQEKLAALLRARGLGTTRKTVRRWERDVVPDAAAQAALCGEFGVPPRKRSTVGLAALAAHWPYRGRRGFVGSSGYS